jgi:hypothetical protein
MSMKKIIIIGAFPNTEEKEKMLSDCIDKLSLSDYDLMVVSHHPLPLYIQEKVNFSIYDKENILDPYEFTPNFFYKTKEFLVEIKSQGHMMPVCRNINNGLSLANHLGYDFFFFLEFDNLIDRNDIQLLNLLHYEMLINDKKMIFFNHFVENKEIYESLIFAGVPNFFLKNVKLPLSISDFKKFEIQLTLEKTFFSQFNIIKDSLLLIETSSKFFFKNSSINKIANYSKCEVIKDVSNNSFHLWISNASTNDNSITIKVDENEPISLGKNGWIMKPIKMGQSIKVELNENGFIDFKEFHLNEETQKEYSDKGTILYY